MKDLGFLSMKYEGLTLKQLCANSVVEATFFTIQHIEEASLFGHHLEEGYSLKYQEEGCLGG